MTSKTRLTNSDKDVSKASSNAPSAQPTQERMFKCLDGKSLPLSEFRRRSVVTMQLDLLYALLEELEKKSA